MYKQLTKEDRLRIYEGLNRNESLSEIGRAIGKDRSTIAREISRNREAKAGSYTGQTRKCKLLEMREDLRSGVPAIRSL